MQLTNRRRGGGVLVVRGRLSYPSYLCTVQLFQGRYSVRDTSRGAVADDCMSEVSIRSHVHSLHIGIKDTNWCLIQYKLVIKFAMIREYPPHSQFLAQCARNFSPRP